MNLTSSRNFVFAGFLISLLSVAFNSIVLSSVGRRLQAVDAEYNRLTESLANQAAELNEGDALLDQYRIMHNLVFAVPEAKRNDAREDAEAILKRFLTRYYAAANDIPRTEITRVEVEEAGEIIPVIEKALRLKQALEAAKPEDKLRIAGELAKLSQAIPEPKSELGRKLREIQKHSQAESADNDLAVMSALLPVMKSFREEIVASIHKKQDRKHELERERSSLGRKANYVSYAALSLQLFGLMLILTRDLLKEKRSG